MTDLATGSPVEPVEPVEPGVHDFITELDVALRFDGVSAPTAAIRIGYDGPIDAGIVAELIDIVGGIVALKHGAPCGISTTELTVHGLHRLRGPGVLTGTASLVSITTNRACVEIDLVVDGSTAGSAVATVAFKLWRDIEIPIPDVWDAGAAARPLDERLWERARLDHDEPNRSTQVDLRPELTNHVAALQGGVTAALLEAAAMTCFEPASALRSMTLTFLRQGRVGPIRATARRTGPDAEVVVVSAVDLGNDERPVAHAIFETAPDRGVGR